MISKNYEKIQRVINSITVNESDIENIIFLFSNYISLSNDNFLYNSTYLTNYTNDFLHFLETFSQKKKLVYQLKDYISSHSQYKSFSIKIDLTWEIKNDEIEIKGLDVKRIINNKFYLEVSEINSNIQEYYYITDISFSKLKSTLESFNKAYNLESERYGKKSFI